MWPNTHLYVLLGVIDVEKNPDDGHCWPKHVVFF